MAVFGLGHFGDLVSGFRTKYVGVLLVGVLLAPSGNAQSFGLGFERVFRDIEFDMPIGLRYAEGDDDYLYVPELPGRVRVFENDPNATESTVFLDLTNNVGPGGQFLDVAFHPDYVNNGYFYVYFASADPRRLKLLRYTRSTTNPLVADPTSKLILFNVVFPGAQNHFGGKIAFGPDGYLYVPMGDGGSLGDALGNGQDRSTLLGSVLRIDVDNPSGGRNYGIPSDNPFVGNTEGWREEIWAWGFRNPYSSSFDRQEGVFWLADVGEQAWEEINIVEAGKNYGWNVVEGLECFDDVACNPDDFESPFYAYEHTTGSGHAVIGGFVYRGSGIPELVGHYIFGDFNFGKLWSMDFSDPENLLITEWPDAPPIPAFGEGPDGELYIPKLFNGQMVRIIRTKGTAIEDDLPGNNSRNVSLSLFPNPTATSTTLTVRAETYTPLRVGLFDILGREMAELYNGSVVAGQSVRIDISDIRLPAGSYMIRVETEGEIQTRQFVKIR